MKRTFVNILFALLAALSFTMMTGTPARAATISVTANTNWSALTGGSGPGGLPNSTDTVEVKNAATLTVDVTNAEVGTLNLGIGSGGSNGNGTLAFSAATSSLYVATALVVGSGAKSGSISMTSGGTLALGGTVTITMAGTWTVGTGTVTYNGTAQTVDATFLTSYYNLTLAGSGAKTLPSGLTTVSNNLTMSGTANATTAANLAISGNLSVGSGTALITGATFTLGVTGTTSVSGTLTLAGTGTKTFTGDVTLNSGGVWNETGVATYAISGNFTNNATTFTANTGTHTFSGAGKTLSGATATVIPTVTFDTGAAPVNKGTLTVATLLTVTTVTLTNDGTITATTALSGTGGVTQGTTGTLNIGGTSGITTLTATAAGNTVNYSGAAQTGKVTTYSNLTLSGSGAKTFATTPTVNAILSMEGTATVVATSGVVTYGSSATLQYSTTTARTATSEEWITPFAATGGVIISSTGNITLNESKAFNASVPLTINSGAKLNASSFTLTIPGTFTATGTFNADTGTVSYTGASQTIAAVTYNNLTINQSSGNATLSGNSTVNGVLTLTAGNLNVTDPLILTMGSAATTVSGTDVTGIVKRTTLVAATTYTFGNQYTTVTFLNTGTLPTDLSVKISIGSAPAWKTDAIKRHYEVVRTGGISSIANLALHYLDAELNSNNETALVKWASESPSTPGTGAEQGKSNYDTTNNWVETANFDVSIWKTSFGLRNISLAATVTTGNTWHGQVSTDWTNLGNWSAGWAPVAGDNVTIADVTNDPTLPSSNVTITTLTLQSGAILTSAASSNLTIIGGSGAWLNSGGAFVPSTGTVTFTGTAATISGTTNFTNIIINSGATLTMQTNSIIRIGGTFARNGTFEANTMVNTVEYNGGSQTVLHPNGTTSHYYHLILSGSGTKTMPDMACGTTGNFTMSGTASATLLASTNVTGSLIIGASNSFTTGAFTHNIGGGFSNSGTFTTTGSTINLNGSSAQTMSGATTFNNLTLNNSSGLTISNDETIGGTLTLTSGNITTGSNIVIITSTGSVSRTSGFVAGNLQKYVTTGGTSITFETGANNDYDPVTVAFGNVTVAGNLTAKVTAGEHPNLSSSAFNSSKDVDDYWTFTNSGISFDSYSATFTFDPSDIAGSANTSQFFIGKYNSGWTYPTMGTRTSTTTQATGLTSFSDFVVAEFTITWVSYNNAAHTVADDNFTAGETTVFMLGNGFQFNHPYVVGYYDGGETKVASDTGLSANASGNLTSQYALDTQPQNAVPGTWHSVVFDSASVPSGNYTAAIADPSFVVADAFTVNAAAIPEFPTVIAAIMVAGSCFGIYYWKRKRLKFNVQSAK